jgi:hypothetical protein
MHALVLLAFLPGRSRSGSGSAPVTIGMGIYYLAWKSFVRFLNEELGIG